MEEIIAAIGAFIAFLLLLNLPSADEAYRELEKDEDPLIQNIVKQNKKLS